MGLIVKLLGGSLGPYIAGAIGAVLLLAIGAASVQTLRLDHAKADLAKCHDGLRLRAGRLPRRAGGLPGGAQAARPGPPGRGGGRQPVAEGLR
jgi:hypothetical protein